MRKIWNPEFKEAKRLLDIYVDVDQIAHDKSLNNGEHFIREMARGKYPLVLKKGEISYFYSFDALFRHIIGQAGEENLSRILEQLGKTWADVYKVVERGRIGGFICTHSVTMEEIDEVTDFIFNNPGVDLKPSEILFELRQRSS